MKKILFLLLLSPLFVHAQIITTFAGDGAAGYAGNGGMATAAALNQPLDVAFDQNGNVYISDEWNYCIRKVSVTGVISTVAGTSVAGYSGDGGPATAAQLQWPAGLAFDAIGNLYIADQGNNCVRKVDTSGIISTIVGNDTAGYSGDGGPATAAHLHDPFSLAFDRYSNLYIADETNDCIRKVDTTGTISTIAGNGSLAGYGGDGGPATAALLFEPLGIAFDSSGNLYIADCSNHRVRKVDTAGIISTIAGNGTMGSTGDGGAATAAELKFPEGMTVDAYGDVYFVDDENSKVRKINAAGIISTVAGTGTTGFSGDGGYATAAEINAATVAVDPNCNLYIADFYNNRVRKLAAIPGISGASKVCTGNTIMLTDPMPGGTWNSSDTAIAKVDSGIVTGIAAGTATITYTVDTSYVMQVVTVNAAPSAIYAYLGYFDYSFSICDDPPQTITLTDSTAGGIWSSDTSIAYIDSAGIVMLNPVWANQGIVPNDTVLYTVPDGCYVTAVVHIYFCEGVPTIPNTNEISIFPNPAHDELTIQSTHESINQILVTNLLGQTVVSRQFSVFSFQCEVDVSGLPAGVYFVKVNGGAASGLSNTLKFVKE